MLPSGERKYNMSANGTEDSHQFKCPKSLLNQCLSILSDDDILLQSLHALQDLPSDLIKMVAAKMSAYCLCLAEEQEILAKSRSTNELWKNLYLRIANRFYEPLSRINSSNTDLKDLYFQRIFHEVVQCFYDELASNGNLQKMFKESRLFSNQCNMSMSRNLGRLQKLLQAQLTTIRLYPRLLKNLHWIFSESSFFEDTLVNIKGVELRDFKYFKKDELAMISLILNKRIVPKLSAITFINCKFNVEIMEWFSQLIDKIGMADNICHQSRSQQSSDGSEMATKKSKKRAANETLMKINANKEEGDETGIPWKKQKVEENRDISLDEAICFDHFYSSYLEESNQSVSDTSTDSTELYGESLTISSLTKLSFLNCHFDQEAVNELCGMVQKMPLLKSFTFCPEWKHSLKCADKILPSILEQSHFKESSLVFASSGIEEIKIENCPLGYNSQKLLLWHPHGECTVQYGVCVPNPKHLKMADCNLKTFRVACTCTEIEDFKYNRRDVLLKEFSHTDKCDTNIWSFDPLLNCTCNWLNLISLDLSENMLQTKGARSLAKALESTPVIQSIKLSDCAIDTLGCQFIFNLAVGKKSLRSLDVSSNSYDGRKDSSLCRLIEKGTLVNLVLSCIFVPDGLPTTLIQSFSRNSTLQRLDLSMNRLCDPVFEALIDVMADSSTLSALEYLDLSQNLIQPELLPEFANALESSKRHLNDLRVTGNISCINNKQFADIMKRRVAQFSDEDSELYYLRRAVNGFADYISVM